MMISPLVLDLPIFTKIKVVMSNPKSIPNLTPKSQSKSESQILSLISAIM